MNKKQPLEILKLSQSVVAGQDCLQAFLAADANANVSTWRGGGGGGEELYHQTKWQDL